MKWNKLWIFLLIACLIPVLGMASSAGRKVVAEPYYDLGLLAKQLKTSRYNPFENPTGLFFQEGEQIEVSVGETGGRELVLQLVDWSCPPSKEAKKEQTSQYPLKQGKNSFTAKNKGLAYVSYYVEDYKNAPLIACDFSSGVYNGVFDSRKHTNEDWEKMVNDAVFDVIDIQGKYVHLVFDVKTLQKECPKNGLGMIGTYDQIILWEQELIGLDQFGYRTNNRMFGRSSWNGLPNANGRGVSFPSIRKIVDPESIKRSNWVIGHEFGHVNQVRPGLKWHGTTEITTNIFSCWVQYKLDPAGGKRLEDANSADGMGEKQIGGTFNWHFNYSVVGQKPWLGRVEENDGDVCKNNNNPFVRLCPMWQLQVYNALSGLGVEDFYAQMSERVRKTDEKGLSAGELQLNFVRNCCDVMKEDMTDFFVRCGMLLPINSKVGDYGGERDMVITAEQIEAVKKYAKKYPQPKSPVSYYITMNSLDAFKNRLPVVGEKGKGIEVAGEKCTVSHDRWKNVVVFEAYQGKKLKRVTMVGTGTTDGSKTVAYFPADCDRLVAVGWDGKRSLVVKR